jgi:hypothetical protein
MMICRLLLGCSIIGAVTLSVDLSVGSEGSLKSWVGYDGNGDGSGDGLTMVTGSDVWGLDVVV